MTVGFYRFRRGLAIRAFLRSLMLGLALGFFIAAAALIASKLFAFSYHSVIWIAVSAGVSAVATALLFLLSLRSDLRVAEKLDAEVLDHERVQTMIAFRDTDSEIVLLQREDTERRLAAVKTGRAKTRGIWIAALLLAVSLALTAVAFVIPAKSETPPDVEIPIDEYEKSWRISRLNSLIDMVENSLMTESAKQDIVAELRALLAVVTESDLESDMRKAAIETILAVDAVVDGVNVGEDIVGVLGNSRNALLLALSEALASQSSTATKKQLTALLTQLRLL